MDRDPVLYRLLEISDGSAAVDLMTPPIGRGHVWVLEEIACCDEDTAGADVEVGVYDGHQFTCFRTHDLTTAGSYYRIPLSMTLLTDYQILIRFLNTSDGDRLHANVNGYIREPFTSP